MIPHHSSKKGFTLVELLIVIAIMAILAGLSVPALSALNRSGQAGLTFSKLSETLEQARQYAVAQNTYVWVAFSASPSSLGTGTQLSIAVVASADGTDLASNWTSSVGPGTNLVQVSKMQTFQLTELQTPGKVTPATILAEVGQAINSTAKFSITLPGQNAATTFGQAIQFTPSGEARNTDGAPVDLVEFDVQPEKGPGIADPNNGAVFQVSGLTGETRIYRQ
jgi:prepilin-type N-terminal cleavage/methylation domain-containing protein